MGSEVVLLTGTSRGIGRYLAEHLCGLGYQVVGCSRGHADFRHQHYRHHCLDVSDEAAVKKMFSAIRKEQGRLDVLVNNAGIFVSNPAMLTPLETVRKIFDINVLGTFLFSRSAARLMKKRNYGRIVNFTTIAVPWRLAGESAYAASKAAVITLTEIMAREFADFGITVNCLGPTAMKTEMLNDLPANEWQDLIAKQALPRIAEMEDVANVVEFFMNPASGMITGQTIYLGGG